MRKTSKDYKKELEYLRTKQEGLEQQIRSRLIQMVEQNPDAIVLELGEDKIKAKGVNKTWIDNLPTDTVITYLQAIEDHNAKLEPYVQMSIYD